MNAELSPRPMPAALRIGKDAVITAGALAAIALHLVLRLGGEAYAHVQQWPLQAVLLIGGALLLIELVRQLRRRELGTDLLAGCSIVTALLLREYLAGAIIVLMLAGGGALEHFAVRNASAALRALAQRMPTVAHRKRDAVVDDVPVSDVNIGDMLVVFPHDICPVDGMVVEGHGVMDESFLTGEPFTMSKAPGAAVLSGAVNGETALTIRATQHAVDSRYAQITAVMRTAEHRRPRLRRLGDRLGALYTPAALACAAAAWWLSGSPERFLAVLVIATPCPLIIAIPVAVIGSIALAARRGIIIRNPAVMEQVELCETVIFDKTGTLTYGTPRVAQLECARGFTREHVLACAAGLERYSKHPLAGAVLAAATSERVDLHEASDISERPGEGLRGTIAGHAVRIASRRHVAGEMVTGLEQLPPTAGGLECLVVIDRAYAAIIRFRDEPRAEGLPFVQHLGPRHRLHRLLVVSGDRASEVRYLAEQVGIRDVYAEQSPEQKLTLVRRETARAKTLFIGDGINDAPALTAATVGIALGVHSDIAGEAADVVVMESSLAKVDEFFHISRRMRMIALQSAVGGMALSLVGMLFAAAGHLPPVAGAVAQEIIDVLAVMNALRAVFPPRILSDFSSLI